MNGPLSYSVIRLCSNPDCKMRFPDTHFLENQFPCPICNSSTEIVQSVDLSKDNRLNSFWQPTLELICILDNVRSVYNVGALFRTAVGFGTSRIFLCGITPTPNHKNFTKSSLGAEKYVTWEKSLNCVDKCIALQNEGYKIISIETSENAISILNVKKDTLYWKKIAIVVGNEISGIDPDVIELSDLDVSIPINGTNKSYNVTTAFGIAIYHFSNLFST